MKHLKTIIVFLILFIIIILGLILFLLSSTKKNNEVKLEEAFTQANQMKEISKLEDYFYVKNCMDKYKMYSLDLYYLLKSENSNAINGADEYRQELIGIIPDFVKSSLGINSNNAYELAGLPDKQLRIDNIYKSMQTVNKVAYENETEIYAYVVESTLIDNSTYEKEKNTTILITDLNTLTFCIIPQSYITKNNLNLNEEDALKIYQDKTIPKNNYNGFNYNVSYKQEDVAKEYLERMKFNLRYDVEGAFDSLDEEYRKARFDNDIDLFREYIKNNGTKLLKATAKKYQLTEADNYNQYVVIDQNGKEYIFRETELMKYNIILDTYSIDLPEFLEKYNSGNEKSKVAMNISKFIEAINEKDYKYAYSKLADGFKQNYFKTEESFETYVKNNFFEDSELVSGSFSNQATTYIYKITIKDKETEELQEQNFIMQLGEGTDFEMSFEIKPGEE